MEDIAHQRSPYEDTVLDPDGYLVPANPLNIENFLLNVRADERRRAKLGFRKRMLSPTQRRSTHIEDRR